MPPCPDARSRRGRSRQPLGALAFACLLIAGCTPLLGPRTGFSGPGELITMRDADQLRELDLMVTAGARWVRLEINWRLIQPTGASSWSWERTDRMVRRARERGLEVLGLLVDTPDWAAVDGCREQFCAPKDPDQFAGFARRAVERYRPLGVRHWEVWNEPNKSVVWKPKPNLDRYATLLIRTSAQIRAADPGATVITGGTAPASDTADGRDLSPITFVRGLYQRGAREAFDAVSHHPYAFQYPLDTDAEWNAWRATERIHEVMRANGDGHKQIWATEVGAPTGTDPAYAVSEARQAEVLAEQLQAWARWPFTGPFFIFSVRDTGDDPAVWVHNQGLVFRDYRAKRALSAVARLLHGGRAPSYPPNGMIDLVRISGDPAGTALLADLALLWNRAPGCAMVAPEAVALDGGCLDANPVAEGRQVAYEPDADGVPAGDENPDRDVAVVLPALGSEAALTQLARSGEPGVAPVDVAHLVRDPRAGDPAGLRFVTFARTGAGWVTWPGGHGAAVSSLTTAKLAQLYGGCAADGSSPAVDRPANGGNGNGVADWGDLGGTPGAPLVLWAPAAGSPSRAVVEQTLGIDMSRCIPPRYRDGSRANGERIVPEGRVELVRSARPVDCALELPSPPSPADPCSAHSVAVMTVGEWLASGGIGTRMGRVSGVEATEATVVAGTYPLVRPHVLALRRAGAAAGPSPMAARQLADVSGFVCRPPAEHARDPRTGRNLGDAVAEAIRAAGAFPLAPGPALPGGPTARCRARDT